MLTSLELWNLRLQTISLGLLAILVLSPDVEEPFVFTVLMLWSTAIAVDVLLDGKQWMRQYYRGRWLRKHALELVVLFLAPVLMLWHVGWIGLFAYRQMSSLVRLLNRWHQTREWFHYFFQRPAQLMAVSFFLLIALGTLLLLFPVSSTKPGSIGLLQAIFTATSASCVTGLTVLDTPTAFTLFGQCVILFLIQIGGLGTMTLSSFVMWLVGYRMGVKGQFALGEILDEPTPAALFRLLRTILFATLVTEALGALLLFCRWYDHARGAWYGLYLSVFHSVSAFCNAGFALWSDSLIQHQTDVVVNVTIICLILAGSLGFPVFASLLPRQTTVNPPLLRKKKTSWRQRALLYLHQLPINTKVILLVQPLLIVVACVGFYALEAQHSLKHLSWFHQGLVSLFQSVTLRTAGFNTIEFGQLQQATLLMMVVWMFIGGCSAGTAGGVKVNTLVVLFLSLRSMLRGRDDVEVMGRRLPHATIRRATVIFFSFVIVLLLGCFFLMVMHPRLPFAHLLFEATSALGTVGLTVNTTTLLNPWGQWIVVLLMYAGRIGPLTIALAISHRPDPGHYRYPLGRIQVG